MKKEQKEIPIITADLKIAKAQYNFAMKIAKKSAKQSTKTSKSTIP